jgi:hypothetical protein
MVHFPDRSPASGQTAGPPTSGTLDVLRERVRQIEAGYDAEHDDMWNENELVLAARDYLTWHALGREPAAASTPPSSWPFPRVDWKPSDDARAHLVKVAALLVAEIDRLDRETERLAAVAAGAEV